MTKDHETIGIIEGKSPVSKFSMFEFKVFVILILVSEVMTACAGSSPTPTTIVGTSVTETIVTEAPTSGAATDTTLRIGWMGIPDTLNPAYAFLSESWTIFHLIYSTLTTQATDGSYVGSLATDWSVSEDDLSWTYHLNEGF
jgi:peptide/nickel transport system substrate-binding protein